MKNVTDVALKPLIILNKNISFSHALNRKLFSRFGCHRFWKLYNNGGVWVWIILVKLWEDLPVNLFIIILGQNGLKPFGLANIQIINYIRVSLWVMISVYDEIYSILFKWFVVVQLILFFFCIERNPSNKFVSLLSCIICGK